MVFLLLSSLDFLIVIFNFNPPFYLVIKNNSAPYLLIKAELIIALKVISLINSLSASSLILINSFPVDMVLAV